MLELVSRFLLIGAIAFGGGQAALPLVERLAVADTGWLTQQQFATGVGLSYATPGPVLILSSYIGYHVAGVPGAIAAALAVFTAPVVLAGLAAQLIRSLQGEAWLQAFGRFAAAAAIGLLGVTVIALASPLFEIHPALLLAAAAVAAAAIFGWHPIVLLVMATVGGAIVALLPLQ